MKATYTVLFSTLALAATSVVGTAQDDQQRQRPPHPIVAALDTNKDGVIDEKEMAAAPAALKTLDKDGDGKLSGEEIRPARRGGGAGGADGGGAGGAGGGAGGAGGGARGGQ